MIEENIERHGLNNMSAEVWDATVFDADSAGKADILVCDLPRQGLERSAERRISATR